MHRIPADAPYLPKWVSNAYDWCEELIFEADASDAFRHLLTPDGRPLKSRLPTRTWYALIRIWPPASLATLELMKSWGVLLSLPALEIPSKEGVEQILTARAE
jgi:hypothetical protein